MRRLALVLTAAALSGAALITSPVAEAQSTVTRTPFSTFQFNQCANGELIELSGTALVVLRDVDKHTVTRFEMSANGIAPSTGARYVAVTGSGSASYSEPDGTPFVLTVVQHIRFVRLGEDRSFPAGDDFGVRVVVHITVTPDGNVATDFSRFEVFCW